MCAELEWLHRGLGVNEFAFYDDALLTNRGHHFLPLCEKILQQQIAATLHTPNGLQAKFIDAATAKLMWQTGFKTIRLAYESGSADGNPVLLPCPDRRGGETVRHADRMRESESGKS